MAQRIERRELLKMMGVGGVVFASSLGSSSSGCGSAASSTRGTRTTDATGGVALGPIDDFFFMQLSDTHWGFSGASVNPNATLELPRAVAAINAATTKPDFAIFTGDLTHTTDDEAERRRRMLEFKSIAAELELPRVLFMPGEHDAAPDAGAVYREVFGDLHYSFDHKGIHFVALDNVSDPTANIGRAQLDWLQADLRALASETPIVVFAHRPLFDLKPEWDWATADGAAALQVLMPYPHVTVFFGHVHQVLHHSTGHIQHHAASSLMFPLPPPETPGKRAPVQWDAEHPERGLGYRSVQTSGEPDALQITEIALAAAVSAP